MTYKIVAITACVSGVAHTYMAAERLEALCKQKKLIIKIETQGALGIENSLTKEDIAQADIVLLITDIEPKGAQRFQKCSCIRSKTSSFLYDPQKVFTAVNKILSLPKSTYVCIDIT